MCKFLQATSDKFFILPVWVVCLPPCLMHCYLRRSMNEIDLEQRQPLQFVFVPKVMPKFKLKPLSE